jgi:hypothetical protein
VSTSLLGVPDVEGPVRILSFAFNAQDVLVDVSSMRMNLSTGGALAAASDIAKSLAEGFGDPHGRVGAFDDAHLSQSGVASLSSIAYRFQDYAVDVILMRMDTDGLVLREHYASIADGSRDGSRVKTSS